MTPTGAGRPNDLRDVAFHNDFLDFVVALSAHGVKYVLVGGYAVGMYGYVRATTDIDFFYRPSPENVQRLVEAMREFGAPLCSRSSGWKHCAPTGRPAIRKRIATI